MRKAKEEISLKDLGIRNTRIKRAVGGVIVIELSGLDGDANAERLRSELTKVLGKTAAVTHPVIRREDYWRGRVDNA